MSIVKSLGALALVGLLALVAAPARAEVSVVPEGIRFTYTNPGAEKVSWVGAFNNWNNTANMFTKSGDTWTITLKLPPGDQQYKFFVDGQWLADPDNPVTGGEFGNSVIKIGADGKLINQAATSNSSLSPKLLIGGRFITEYISRKNPLSDNRMELNRPTFNLDVNFNVRMSDVLDGRMLANIQSEYDNVPFYRTRLNFDRGSLHLHSDQVDLLAFDNDSLGTWEDPLHILGDVGIYHHAFGFAQQGMQARKEVLGNDVRVMYSDNFNTGGTTAPTTSGVTIGSYKDHNGVRLLGPAFRADYEKNFGDQAKNILAGRAVREVAKGLRLGLSGRLDRGQNPGNASIYEADAPDSTGYRTSARLTMGTSIERWWAAGGDFEYRHGGSRLSGEYLHGRNILAMSASGLVLHQQALARNDSLIFLSTPIPEAPGDFRLNDDDRARLEWSGKVLGNLEASLAWDLHRSHVYPLGNDSVTALSVVTNVISMDSLRATPELRNRMTTWAGRIGRTWERAGGRRVTARLALDYAVFHYDGATPWLQQFWFDRHNFWLDAGEHRVGYDRMTLMGGDNVVSWKPTLSVDLSSKLNVRFQGTWNGVSFDTRPKYMENLFQATLKTGSRTHLYWDMRWAKYDDPVLSLGHGYVDQFVRLSYDFSPTIVFEGSWGVDPYVLDGKVNEYAYIGRDMFLFGKGATGAVAEDNYMSLARAIPAAEKALEDERRLQLRAVVRF